MNTGPDRLVFITHSYVLGDVSSQDRQFSIHNVFIYARRD